MQTQTTDLPVIKSDLPGPKTQALIERDKKVMSPSYTRGYPLAIEKGEGAIVTDPDGNTFLDFCAGIAVCATGHSHPEVVKAIQDQAANYLHMSGTDFYYEPMVDLSERLAKNSPGSPDKKVFLTNSGTESVEGALKLARYNSGRQNIISFFRSFHGRTFGSMSVTASKSTQRKYFSPLVPGVYHAHYPYPYRDISTEYCLDYIKNTLFKHVCRPDELAAILVEPIQGEGGYVVPPDDFLLGLQELSREHGFLIIADEVQSGIGRTGKMWASDHVAGFEPDIITSAKGIASGMPLGAIIAKGHVMNWTPGTHATTYGGNPVACAAAVKTLELIEGGLMQNADQQGQYLTERLKGFQDKYDVIGDIRGRGLMLGIEIVKSKAGKEKAAELRDKIVDDAYYEGLLILGCGENTIRLCPPLVVNQAQCDYVVETLDKVIQKLA